MNKTWVNIEDSNIRTSDDKEKDNLRNAIRCGLDISSFDGIVIHGSIPEDWFESETKILAIFHKYYNEAKIENKTFYIIKDKNVHMELENIIQVFYKANSVRKDTQLPRHAHYLLYKCINAAVFAICDIVHDVAIQPYDNDEKIAVKKLNRIFKRFIHNDLPLIKTTNETIALMAQGNPNIPEDIDEIIRTNEDFFIIKEGKSYKFKNKLFVPDDNIDDLDLFDSIGIGIPYSIIFEDPSIIQDLIPDNNEIEAIVKRNVKDWYEKIYKHRMQLLDISFRNKVAQLEAEYNSKMRQLEKDVEKALRNKIEVWFDIIEYFSNTYTTIIKNEILWIRINLFPSAIKSNGKIYRLPENYRYVYYVGWIGIPMQVRLSKGYAKMYRHPNISDNGSICLGDLQGKEVSVEVINQLIEALKIVNYDSSFYVDTYMIRLLDKIEDIRSNWGFSWE